MNQRKIVPLEVPMGRAGQNPQFGSKSSIFLSRVTLNSDGWPQKTIGHLCYLKLYASFHSHRWIKTGYNPETPDSGQNRRFFLFIIYLFFCPCDLEIWRITLKNNRAPLLCYVNLYASFHSHLWFQTGDTVRKCPTGVEIDDFFSRLTLRFDRWPWKSIGHRS